MDVRNLIFPMQARDLVESAVVIGQVRRSSGALELATFEVMGRMSSGETRLAIDLRDQKMADEGKGGSDFTVELYADTPLLVTSIRRS